MSIEKIKSFTSTLAVVLLLLTACSKNVDSETIAYQFTQLYFGEDNLVEAVKLTSGSARTKLEGYLREIEAGGKQAAEDKPLVKSELQETQVVSPDEMLYVYRVTSDLELAGMGPITARLWLSKEGNTWSVSKFVQQE